MADVVHVYDEIAEQDNIGESGLRWVRREETSSMKAFLGLGGQ